MARGRASRLIVKELKIAGEDVKIWFTPDDNIFEASLLDEDFKENNYSTILGKLRKKGKEYKPTVSIPVTHVDRHGGEGEDFIVTGMHSGNGNIIARDVKTGEIRQFGMSEFADWNPEQKRNSWYSEERTPRIVRALTAAEKKELSDMRKKIRAAEKELEAKIRSFRIKIFAAIKQAQRAEKTAMNAAEKFEGDPREVAEIEQGLRALKAKHGRGKHVG